MTLIKLLAVIVIVGILSAISIPNFLNHIRRSRVAEAQTALAVSAVLQKFSEWTSWFILLPTPILNLAGSTGIAICKILGKPPTIVFLKLFLPLPAQAAFVG
jgi:hypothetical protein